MPKIKSQKSDAEDAIRMNITIEQASHRRVYIEGLTKLFKKDIVKDYPIDLLKSLHIQHLGFDPVVEEESKE